MVKQAARKRQSGKAAKGNGGAGKNANVVEDVVEEGLATVESLLPSGSPQRAAAGIAAAAGGALVLAAMFGVGPTALAGAAGYLAYRASGRK